jgi:hypothetical protein
VPQCWRRRGRDGRLALAGHPGGRGDLRVEGGIDSGGDGRSVLGWDEAWSDLADAEERIGVLGDRYRAPLAPAGRRLRLGCPMRLGGMLRATSGRGVPPGWGVAGRVVDEPAGREQGLRRAIRWLLAAIGLLFITIVLSAA